MSASKKVIVVLEKACLETVKTKHGVELITADTHASILKKLKKDPTQFRPDILHQCLLTLLDSPLNKAGHLQIYIHTTQNVLIQVSPHVRIPRTFKVRVVGVAVKDCQLASLVFEHPNSTHTMYAYTHARPRTHAQRFAGLMVQLLYKLKIRAADGPEVLLKVIKNPVTQHFPAGARKVGTSR